MSRPKVIIQRIVYVLFLLALASVCYRHPIPDDFDRYIYEAIVRSKKQPIETVYEVVKHSSRRAEASTVLDSPRHMVELMPMYTIRPLYIDTISALADTGLSVQKCINAISAASFFGIGLLVLAWSKRVLLGGILLASSPIIAIGRMGTPDALSALVVLAALWMLWNDYWRTCLVLLVASLLVRTDNLVLALIVIGYLMAQRKIDLLRGTAVSCVMVILVMALNRWAGNYGWLVLFRHSFLAGASFPAEVESHVTLSEYAGVLRHSFLSIVSRWAIWIVLGVAVWRLNSVFRNLLAVAALASLAHFLLYPSPEDRYFIWVYILIGICFVGTVADQGDCNTRDAHNSILST